MTTQQNLEQVWALSGGVTDPGDTKYGDGWIAEIPTYQNFNFVLQTTTKNILAMAEANVYAWQADITYAVGAKTKDGTKVYYCTVTNTNEQPTLDTLRNFWSLSPVFGNLASIDDKNKGLHLDNVDASALGTWGSQSHTITAPRPTIALNTTGATDNHLLSNISGWLCTVNVGNTQAPDDRNVAIGQSGVYKIYHEGFKPTQGDVSGTIPNNPQDGGMYARVNSSWVVVTGTIVSAAPPPPVTGAGQGWYNLVDGVHYTDVNDGDSSQWAPTSPARTVLASAIPYDNGASGLTATTMQAAIDELAALH